MFDGHTASARLGEIRPGQTFYFGAWAGHREHVVLTPEEFHQVHPDRKIHPGWVPHRCMTCGEVTTEVGHLLVYTEKYYEDEEL